jgi:predicted flap endonuclease-1-like 5' DNA nuclease
MTYKIDEVEGIGPSYAGKLSEAGIKTTDDLLKLCCDAKGRQTVSDKTSISTSRLLEWANMADLMRVSGVGKQYAELLEAAGVDTVKELRNRNAANLAEKMAEVNNVKKLCKSNPAETMVNKWVEQAKKMDPVITH